MLDHFTYSFKECQKAQKYVHTFTWVSAQHTTFLKNIMYLH